MRRVVTGHSPDGKAIFSEDSDVAAKPIAARPGSELATVWTTEANALDGPPPFFPGPGSTRFMVIRLAPESMGGASDAGEADFPGSAGVFEKGSRMHRTATIDYGICLDGEVWLELDDGAETLVTPGTCVVQRGTRHAWHNRTDRPCTMAFFLLGTGTESE